MEDLTPDKLSALDVAFNDATLVGVEMDTRMRRFSATLAVLSLPPDDGPAPADPRIKLVLEPVGRLAVSLREGRWDDPAAQSEPLALDALSAAVADFGQLPIYGWEFLDAESTLLSNGATGLSLDLELGPERAHTLDLFQEGDDRFIELRVWFDTLSIWRSDDGQLRAVPFDEVGAAGARWWDALNAGDPRTSFAGIVPLSD